MSMEEFIRELEKNPNPTGGLGGAGSGDELIRVRSTRKIKDPQTQEESELTEIDVDGKTRLSSPTAFTIAESTAEYLEKTFGDREGVTMLKNFLGMGPTGKTAGFKVNMISKDGLSRDEHIRLKNQQSKLEDEQKSLLEKLAKM